MVFYGVLLHPSPKASKITFFSLCLDDNCHPFIRDQQDLRGRVSFNELKPTMNLIANLIEKVTAPLKSRKGDNLVGWVGVHTGKYIQNVWTNDVVVKFTFFVLPYNR